MKKPNRRKLELDREVIRALSTAHLGRAAGGEASDHCVPSCGGCPCDNVREP